MKNFNDTIGNRTRDIPTCSAVSQSTALPRAPGPTKCTNAQHIYIYIYRVSQEERTKLREGVPHVKLYRYNPKHLCPKLNGFRDNGK